MWPRREASHCGWRVWQTTVARAHDDGRVTTRYPYDNVATPYEKLKSLDDAERFLKPGVSFAELDAFAGSVSDLDAARAGPDAGPARTLGRPGSGPGEGGVRLGIFRCHRRPRGPGSHPA